MVGRLDPKTGEIKLVTSPTPRRGPTAWWSIPKNVVRRCVEFGTNKLATIDPKTMAIKEYALPDAGVAPAPHRDRRRTT